MKTYILFSSMSMSDPNNHQVVAVGDKEKLKKLAKNFGVNNWTIEDDGICVAENGQLRLVPAQVWEG